MLWHVGFPVLRRNCVYPFRFRYLGVRVHHTGLAFTVFPLLPPSGSGLVVVTGRCLPCVVDAALRLGVGWSKKKPLVKPRWKNPSLLD